MKKQLAAGVAVAESSIAAALAVLWTLLAAFAALGFWSPAVSRTCLLADFADLALWLAVLPVDFAGPWLAVAGLDPWSAPVLELWPAVASPV